ncbi:Hypothetical predicted protein, partial [Cloeon dipterum]
PEKRFEVWQSRGPREGLVNISCLATGAFPEPKLSLYPDSGTLEDVKIETRSQKGSYDVLASTVIEYPLEPTVFHCELRIPEAQYEIKKNFVYYPVCNYNWVAAVGGEQEVFMVCSIHVYTSGRDELGVVKRERAARMSLPDSEFNFL